MGLLDSILVQQNNKKKSSSSLSAQDYNNSSDFYSAVNLLKEDDTFLDAILGLIHRFFHFDKIVILTYHFKTDTWVPAASFGLDITSTRRIRFSRNFYSSLFPLPFSVLEKPEQLSLFKPLLSIREFSMLTRIETICPDSHSSKPKTALMILNADENNDFKKELLFTVEKIENVLENNTTADETSFSIALFVTQFLSKSKDKKFYLFKLDCEEIIMFIQETLTEDFEKKQLIQDIFDTIYSMIKFSGRLLQIDTYTSLLLYSSTSIHNPQLLISQITNSIKHYYNLQIDVPSITNTYLTYPDDGEDAETLLKKMQIL